VLKDRVGKVRGGIGKKWGRDMGQKRGHNVEITWWFQPERGKNCKGLGGEKNNELLAFLETDGKRGKPTKKFDRSRGKV